MSDFKFTEQERDHLKSEIESRAYIGPDEKIYIGTKDLFDRIEQIINERDDQECAELRRQMSEPVDGDWKLVGHSYQIGDTGDYDGHYEITNGKLSILTKDDDDEALQPIVNALNSSGCKFYQDDWYEHENGILKLEISELRRQIDELKKQNRKLNFMIDNGLGDMDMKNDL